MSYRSTGQGKQAYVWLRLATSNRVSRAGLVSLFGHRRGCRCYVLHQCSGSCSCFWCLFLQRRLGCHHIQPRPSTWPSLTASAAYYYHGSKPPRKVIPAYPRNRNKDSCNASQRKRKKIEAERPCAICRPAVGSAFGKRI